MNDWHDNIFLYGPILCPHACMYACVKKGQDKLKLLSDSLNIEQSKLGK